MRQAEKLATAVLCVFTLLVGGCAAVNEFDDEPVVVAMPFPAPPVDLDFDEEFDVDDIGESVRLNGVVVGRPGAAGFFLRFDGDDIVFIQTSQDLKAGQAVQVLGTLAAAKRKSFSEWERDLLIEADPSWTVVRDFFIANAAATVREPR